MKAASHRNCTLQVTRIWTGSTEHEMGVCFYTAKPLCWFQPSPAIVCSTLQQRVKYEDSQHFV